MLGCCLFVFRAQQKTRLTSPLLATTTAISSIGIQDGCQNKIISQRADMALQSRLRKHHSPDSCRHVTMRRRRFCRGKLNSSVKVHLAICTNFAMYKAVQHWFKRASQTSSFIEIKVQHKQHLLKPIRKQNRNDVRPFLHFSPDVCS